MKISKIALIALATASFGLASGLSECVSECSMGNISKLPECVSSCTRMEIDNRLNSGLGEISSGLLPNSAKDDPCGRIIADKFRRDGKPIPAGLQKALDNCPYPY